MEGVGHAVLRHVHSLGGSRLGHVVLVQHVQVLVQMLEGGELLRVSSLQSVQAGGLHAHADVQRGVAGAAGLGLAGRFFPSLGLAGGAGGSAGRAGAGIVAAGAEGGAHQGQSQNDSQDLSELHSKFPLIFRVIKFCEPVGPPSTHNVVIISQICKFCNRYLRKIHISFWNLFVLCDYHFPNSGNEGWKISQICNHFLRAQWKYFLFIQAFSTIP